METTLAFAAATWAIAMALSPALQIRRIFELKSARGVSIAYFLVLLVGFALGAVLLWAIGPMLRPGFQGPPRDPEAVERTPEPKTPPHTEEAEVVQTLAAAPPPYIVTLNDRFGFFQEAPAYYLVLRDFIRRHYVLGFRTGRYDVLRRRDLPAVPDRGEPEPEPVHPPERHPGDQPQPKPPVQEPPKQEPHTGHKNPDGSVGLRNGVPPQ